MVQVIDTLTMTFELSAPKTLKLHGKRKSVKWTIFVTEEGLKPLYRWFHWFISIFSFFKSDEEGLLLREEKDPASNGDEIVLECTSSQNEIVYLVKTHEGPISDLTIDFYGEIDELIIDDGDSKRVYKHGANLKKK